MSRAFGMRPVVEIMHRNFVTCFEHLSGAAAICTTEATVPLVRTPFLLTSLGEAFTLKAPRPSSAIPGTKVVAGHCTTQGG